MSAVTTGARVSLRNILVATDFSEYSAKALDYGAQIAQRYDSTIHLLHVIRPGIPNELLSPQSLPDDIEREKQAAEEQLQSWAQRLNEIQYKTWLKYGDVPEVVKTLMAVENVDLIVLGTHGRSGLKKLVLGSVAQAIFREADCPVLTIGPKTHDIALPGKLRNVLYAVDPLEESHCALDYAVSLAEKNGATLTLLHVMAQDTPARPSLEREAECRELVAGLIPGDAQLAAAANCRIEFSKSPTSMIIAVAHELPADLLVMDVRREEAWTAHLPDNAYAVVAQAACPVLTVHTVRKRES
ncbi:MAG TPA: universal stress protein [Clostridia bacterium]|nr:universal stress protein [Clostridia bacterium]